MKMIVVWLWGAGLMSSWWAALALGKAAEPLILLPVFGSVATAVAFAYYAHKYWNWR
jgi:hypothetical protein